MFAIELPHFVSWFVASKVMLKILFGFAPPNATTHDEEAISHFGGAAWAFHSGSAAQRKVFTTPLLSEANKRRSCNQFTKKKSRCQRGGVRGVANQNATTERATL